MRVFLRILTFLMITTPYSCGENLLKEASSTSSDFYYIEEAKKSLNKKDYTKAQESLDKINNKTSDEHVLQVSVYLGSAGFSMWDILIETADSLTNSSSSEGSGLESFFNAMSGSDSIFGDEDSRFAMMAGIAQAIDYLKLLESTSENASKLLNIRCILASVLLLPTSADTTVAVNNAFTALNSLSDEISSSSDSCPSLTGLSEATDNVALIQSNLDLIIDTAQGCTMMDFLTSSGAITQLTDTIAKMKTGADKGCASLDCGDSAICNALANECVVNLLDSSSAVSGDGVVDRCEIMQNCQTVSDCF